MTVHSQQRARLAWIPHIARPWASAHSHDAETTSIPMHIYLHIGYPKTGSSAIQSHVNTNQKWFSQNGIYIPKTGYAGALGHAFLLGGQNYPLTGGNAAPPPVSVSKLDELNAELAAASDQGFGCALLTWEGFAMLNAPARQELSAGLRSHRVTVLAYLREQSALYQSAVLQQIESLKNFSAEAMFGSGYRNIPTLGNYDFHAMMLQWQNAFVDSGSVRTRLFERSLLADGNVVTDFINWLGLHPDAEFCQQEQQVNQSIDATAATLILIARSAGLMPIALTALSRALATLSRDDGVTDKFFLSPEDLRFFSERFAASNQACFREFRPENAPQSMHTFDDPLETQNRSTSPQMAYLKAVYDGLRNPQLEVWDGAVLTQHKVARIARAPNAGWRGPEPNGVWSQGDSSTLSFQIPATHANLGPDAIVLRIHGTYFGSNSNTTLTINGQTQRLDLSRAEIRIDMAGICIGGDVTIELQHQLPALPESPAEHNSDSGIAFMLQHFAYTFRWD